MGAIKTFFENIISKFKKNENKEPENATMQEYQKYLEHASNSSNLSEVLKDGDNNITRIIPSEKGAISIMKRSNNTEFAEYKHYKGVVNIPNNDEENKDYFVDLEHVYRPCLCPDGIGILNELEKIDGNILDIESGKVNTLSYTKEGNEIKLDGKIEDVQIAYNSINYMQNIEKLSNDAYLENAFQEIFESPQDLN